MVSTPGYLYEGSHNPPLVSKPTAGELLVGGSSNPGSSRRTQNNLKCVFCSCNHWSDECSGYTTQHARMEKLRGSCFNCLQRGHVAKGCQRLWTCFHCSKNNHHRSLFPKLFTATGDQPRESGLQSIHTLSNGREAKHEAATVACANQVLMQTATATAVNTSGNQSIPVRMILDSGSQRTYI